MKVSVIGLGKLGLPMAAIFASKGHEVTGIDTNPELIAKLIVGECPIQEPGLKELLKITGRSIRFTTASISSDIDFIIVPTPSDNTGSFTSRYVLEAIRSLNLKKGQIVVITSTVMPGTMEKEIAPLVPKGIGLCYSPEFVALGNVIKGMLEPDGILIGQSDPTSGITLEYFMLGICENKPQVSRMSFYNAELAKLALNVFITAKITFANQLAEICENIPGGNVDTIVKFLGSDSRIGLKYLVSGIGFGGPCFPRDNEAFLSAFPSSLIQKSVIQTNDQIPYRIVTITRKMLVGISHPTISILGLTYKPDTPVIEESRAIILIKKLCTDYLVKVYDPQGIPEAKKVLPETVIYSENVLDCLMGSDLCVICTTWNEFKVITPDLLKKHMRRPAVFDCWRMLPRKAFKEQNIIYKAIGISPND